MAKQKQKPQVNISQSFIKRVWDYVYGTGCGVALREIDILKNYERESSDVMKLGQYFEYVSTGQVLRDGKIPEMPATLRGAPTAEAKRAMLQAANFKKMIKEKGITILDTGVVVEHEGNKIVLDALVSTPDYEQAILDIKFTGLLGDKWHDMGWTLGSYAYREGLKIQPIMYKYVYWKKHGIYDIPFYYAIHSSKNETDYDVWEVSVAGFETVMRELEEEIERVRKIVDNYESLSPRPEVKLCASCPVFNDCVFRETVPATKSVTIFRMRNEDREAK